MGIVLAQFPFLYVNLLIIELRVRCSLSTTPFPWGWYGDETTCCIPNCFTHFLKKIPMNCGQLSVMILTGKPHLVNTDIRFLVIILAVVVRNGIASGHLVARSTALADT